MIPDDRARVQVRVDVPREEAWRVFTEEIDRWWLAGRRFRSAGPRRSVVHLEPRVGGRLFERIETERGEILLTTGEVLACQPPEHLVIRWRNVNFREDETTRVEVWFADQGGRTLVTLEHSGWAAIRADHPARHGKPPDAFLADMGRWWGELLGHLRRTAAQPRPG